MNDVITWAPPGPVLVGTDLTDSAQEALRQAAGLARALDAPLKVCHVLPELARVAMLFPQSRANPSLLAEMTGRAHAAVRRELNAVLGSEGEQIEIALDSVTPHVGLLAQADATNAGLVVTGPGDTAMQVVRHAIVPVLVARPSGRGPVIAATDFSESSSVALTAACAEAARRQEPLHLIHVLDLGSYALGQQPTGLPADLRGTSAIAFDGLDDVHAEATRRLHDGLQECAVDGQVAVISGHAAQAIVSYSESVGAALIVVGAHGRSRFARLTLGSTAAHVIESAPCSVLVVRTTAAQSPALR